MISERWQQVKELFEAALERGPAERSAFLATACAGDEEVRREVESLLAAHDGDSSFMNRPVGKLLVNDEPMLATGQRLGQYEAISPLGAGGMGEVYLAMDTRLGRKVALKLLPSNYTHDAERVRRFGQEARAASALNHPNIVTIHEIGETDSFHFIATEFIEGETLRERMTNTRMTLSEALDVAAQIAAALQAAHEAGIVHRDIKPENIMLRRDGIVKALDFGLAKLTPRQMLTAAGAQGTASSTVQTNPGVVMGTVGYMSPEQARGEEVDARTDIWSLGVVLYEMAAGRAPFAGETPSHAIVSIMEDEPLSLDAEEPTELERIIKKALCKNVDGRYQTAGEMARELKSLKQELEVEARLKQGLQPNASGKKAAARGDGFGVVGAVREPAARTGHVIPARPTASVERLVGKIKRHTTFAAAALLIFLVGAMGLTRFGINRDKADSGAREKKSIAVLPLKPINAANRDEIYEIGIADSLIHRLGSMKGFIVRPLSATRRYTDIEQDPLAAGREQQVDYVLASNYQLADGKIRVTAQLINVANGQIEETRIIEKDAGKIFATQDAIASEVGKLLQTRFVTTSDIPAAKRGTNNEEAYRLYLLAKNLTMKRNEVDAKKAVEYLEQAIRLDPNYASAYAGMANAFRKANLDSSREKAKVKEFIKQALELDSNLAEAYVARADVELLVEWDFPAVEKDLLHAIELEPNNDTAHWLYALLLAYRGRFDEAMAEIETAQAIDPGALVYMRDRGRILYYARRYDEAIVQLKRVIDLDENFETAHGWLRVAYAMKGDESQAYELFMKTQKRTNPDRVEIYQKTYETAGWQGVKRKIFEFSKLDAHKPGSELYAIANLAAVLGEKDQAFEYLNKAVERREWRIIMLNVDPPLDPLRDDPRFAEIVRRVGLK
jgi:serine/threonine-protein kinase